MIIGLTGENCAGKGVVAEHLQKKGFYYLSLSDVIREELKKEGKEITRENLIASGNILREKLGAGALGRITSEKIQDDKNYVVDSIRNPAEVEELQKHKRFVLIYVTAPPEMRFARMKARHRENDAETLEQFLEFEKKEMENKDKTKQNLKATFAMAKQRLVNDGELEALYETADNVVGDMASGMQSDRPDWDSYFMQIAKVVASRSNCVKRKVAAIIVKDKRIISTGYNGTPRGTRNCNEGGCPRCNNFGESGKNLEDCLCSHGEENAIVQASYHGIGIKDSTIYTTFSPCLICTKMIINAGLKEVVYNVDYPINEVPLKLLREAGVEVRQHRVE
ncbi:AAA family ATPase [Candidatus Micrarchaeota archaeon]|nr:AAA family ATPase [Candidatus Micrarchaeota archaeon]MBU1166426.1 AAA family ATPase [Candidatus Micrarchaeota archaeon]MBU1887459.1 AAA family ATPase [Candidatus Micrarchaeota archaeon]